MGASSNRADGTLDLRITRLRQSWGARFLFRHQGGGGFAVGDEQEMSNEETRDEAFWGTMAYPISVLTNALNHCDGNSSFGWLYVDSAERGFL